MTDSICPGLRPSAARVSLRGLAVLLLAARVCRAAATNDSATLEQRLADSEAAIQALQEQVTELRAEREADGAPGGGLRLPSAIPLLVSGSGQIAWFDNEHPKGNPDSGFRVDEALLFLEARLLERVFLFTEIKIAEREQDDDYLHLGELYVDVEDLTGTVLPRGLLNLRAGRFDIPFGEEYAHRDGIDNALVSHSLADIWGVDEGVGLFGQYGIVDYVVALQNGEHAATFEGDKDKAVIARVGVTPAAGWRASASAMRTGDLSPAADESSEVWFGNALFVARGDPETTRAFGVELWQGDLRRTWDGGYAAAAGGVMRYTDDDTAADHTHEAPYYSLEASQDLVGDLYAAARYSEIRGDDGVWLIAQGPYRRLVEGPALDEIWRLSLALGYRWSRSLVLKGEYSIERGDYRDGSEFPDEDLASAALAFGF